MKKRGLERVERRRPLIELNLISEPRPRLAKARRGCVSFLSPSLLAIAGFGVIAAHLSGHA